VFGWGLVLVSTFLIDHLISLVCASLALSARETVYGEGVHDARAVSSDPTPAVRWLVFAFWMTPTMTLAHLVFSMMTTAYILVAIQLEEHDLVREFGATYEQYRRRVPMLVPFTRSHQKVDTAAGVKPLARPDSQPREAVHRLRNRGTLTGCAILYIFRIPDDESFGPARAMAAKAPRARRLSADVDARRSEPRSGTSSGGRSISMRSDRPDEGS